MSSTLENQIYQAEEQLRLAMLHSDIAMLDALLSPELIFTNHLGQRLGKHDDLAAHKSGLVKINEVDCSEQQILTSENIAVVSVRMKISGSYDGTLANGDFRFTRIWAKRKDSWQVISAHSSLIA
ncbi:conserved hypothetical protein [Chloroherpeton thalassium ATCC 35110]|uniref:DUF4440 domain-containing protein n=1 Tax=Chloroherpeton thalassium (strain ATCC 35110 / GB-78) TaxID=517418 RepID=B3QS71_CHLT3|nr:nuclear transport factor 2 family protein [Chloroherpeton thalassium]ACF14016.1 conserved hypothetical protein [Chloroherpeton thalassium ATCC 35110]